MNCPEWQTACWEQLSFNIKQNLVSALTDDYWDYASDLYKSYIIKEGLPLYGLAPGGGDRMGAGPGGSRGFVAGVQRSPSTRHRLPPGGKVCPNSFVAGTLVLMADGTTKPIEDVRPGDVVLATDPETGITEPQPVTDTITGFGERSLVHITVATAENAAVTGAITAGSFWRASITATDEHPFWDAGRRMWTAAGDLNIGVQLLTPNGLGATVTGITISDDLAIAYNLTIADLRTYYVLAAAAPILVHNCPASISKGRWDHIWERHVNRTKFPNKSKFNTTNKSKIDRMINRAIDGGTRDGVYSYRFPYAIGTNPAGDPQNYIRVVVRGGSVITAFPASAP